MSPEAGTSCRCCRRMSASWPAMSRSVPTTCSVRLERLSCARVSLERTRMHSVVRRKRSSEISSAKRSEEHTSELQSLMRISYAVFCLKKKNRKRQHLHYTQNGIMKNEKDHKKQNMINESYLICSGRQNA